MPTYPLPGTGASTRIDFAPSANCRSLSNCAIALTLTLPSFAGARCQIVGLDAKLRDHRPVFSSTTRPGAPKLASVSSIICACRSNASWSNSPVDPPVSSAWKSGNCQSTRGRVLIDRSGRNGGLFLVRWLEDCGSVGASSKFLAAAFRTSSGKSSSVGSEHRAAR